MTTRSFDFPPVEEAESGQKLLQFLERRLGLPSNLIHRWIRTGQIRHNGKRCKPFERVATGDIVRLPPFAGQLAEQSRAEEPAPSELARNAPLPPLIGEKDGLLIFHKPAGLAVQPGTGITDALSSRLAAHFAALPFKPVPCHRLDKDTSGAIIVAKTFEALRRVQEQLSSGQIRKEYLAWTEGAWPYDGAVLLKHYLRKEAREDGSKIRVSNTPLPYAKESRCVARPLRKEGDRTLLQIWLLTGRTHQIRAQLAACGHPVVGDGKYGKPGILRLHAMRIIFPDGDEFARAPDWEGAWSAEEIPPPIPALAAGENC